MDFTNYSLFADEVASASQESPSLYGVRSLRPESPEVVHQALQTDAVARRILAKGERIEPGQLCGVRLNINVLVHTGVAVHSIHRATNKDGYTQNRGFYRGEVLSYLPVVLLRNAFFNVHQAGREGIASGTMAKHPMASIDGTFVEQPQELSFNGVEISFNPKNQHLFVDSEGYAVQYAEEVTILGHRAYARGEIRYYSQNNAPAKVGTARSQTRFRT